MPPRHNPHKLNGLQLRTLAILQVIARIEGAGREGPGAGEITVMRFPDPHGDHLHVGEMVVSARDASGLFNEAVWNALTRKGLARADWPHQITLTAEALEYETGVADEILRKAEKH
ncbi:MAG: hypothetical protein ACT4OG_09875 [Alphaproteobacteria bacterium]